MTGRISYVLMDPSRNMTVLAETPVPADEQPSVAAQLMRQEPTAEQVGFLALPHPDDPDGILRLRMAGGEFCGNASMSAAAYWAMRTNRSEGRFTLHVSGAPDPVTVDIGASENGETSSRRAAVHMPRPVSIDTISFLEGYDLPVVTFEGISHVILVRKTDSGSGKDSAAGIFMDRGTAEEYARSWCSYLDADAVGLMFLDQDAGSLTPLVYVPEAGTLFWENACASGTAAVGAWLANKAGSPVNLALRQPGGVLKISADPCGSLLLTGTVRCVHRKTAELY